MACFPKTVTVMCMGEFDGCKYIGGKKKYVTILDDQVLNLRYNINHELPAEWSSAHYGIYYISKSSWFSTKKKHELLFDDDLLRLCTQDSDPVVYIDHDVGPVREDDVEEVNAPEDDVEEVYSLEDDVEPAQEVYAPAQDVYVPSFDYPQSSGFGYDLQTTVPVDDGLEMLQRYAGSDWFHEYGTQSYQPHQYDTIAPWGSWPQSDSAAQSYRPETFAQSSQPWGPVQYTDVSSQHETWGSWPPETSWQQQQPESSWQQRQPETETSWQQPETSQQDDDDIDGDYVPLTSGTDSDASDELSDTEELRFSKYDFAAWSRREGRLSRDQEGDYDEDFDLPIDPDEMTNWLLPVIPLDPSTSFVQPDLNPPRVKVVKLKATFNSKEEVALAVGLMCMKDGKEPEVDKSDTKRIYYKCRASNNCTFKVRATPDQDKLIWTVNRFVPEHTCGREVGRVSRVNAHANVVAKFVSRRVHDEGELLKPRSIQHELQDEFGVEIHYNLALKARNLAIELVYGSHDQSYQLVPSYLYMLKKCNPGSRVHCDVGPDGHFRHCFVALWANISAYSMGLLRPVIVIDGTHLKGKARGVLFLAATKDANEQLYLLAYGVGPKENDESWSYFLRHFVNAFGDAAPLLVVSDQHKSIANAVKHDMEHATHAYCYYHMQKNLHSHHKKGVLSRFFEASYSYDKTVTDMKMRELEKKNNKAWQKLTNIGVAKWSRAHCPVRRYSFMTSNAAESMNSKLRWSRHLPICSLLEAVRLVQDEWMSSRRIRAQRSTDILSEEAHKRIDKEASEARRHFVRHVSGEVYRVKADDVYVLVDLNSRTCECGVFWIDEFPCSHAYAAIM